MPETIEGTLTEAQKNEISMLLRTVIPETYGYFIGVVDIENERSLTLMSNINPDILSDFFKQIGESNDDDPFDERESYKTHKAIKPS